MTRATQVLTGFLLILFLLAPLTTRAAGRGEPGPIFPVRVELPDGRRDLEVLHRLDLDIDGVFDGWARVYVIAEERAKLQAMGFVVHRLGEERGILAWRALEEGALPPPPSDPGYHNYSALSSGLADIAAAYPEITRLMSIGPSVKGRELWMMKISRNPDLEEDEPEFAYIAAMHGDEVVGKELCFYLIEYLTANYGTDPRVTTLVDTTEIWILPSMNPDGTQRGLRYNGNYVDLNRDFPDPYTDPVNTPDGREPETQAVMVWAAAHSTNLSANYHGGAVVVTYPYSSNADGAAVYTPTAEDGLFVSLARTYADNNPPMSVGNVSVPFNNGITNLAHWFPLNGSLQDWSYIWRGDIDLIIELSHEKWPDASLLPTFWNDNRESMLVFLERVHEGIRGIVTDETTGAPLAATLRIQGVDHPFTTDPDVGDYHRVLLPGSYMLEVSAVGYSTALVGPVTVGPGPAVRHDVALEPLAPRLAPVGGCVPDGPSCEPWLVPGATDDLAVTVRNLGMAVSAVSATLVPTGWFARVTRPDAAYPDLLPGETGDPEPPAHEVALAPDVPPGHHVGFAVAWEAAEGGGLSDPFFLPVGPPACTVAAASDLPLSIEDRQTTTSQLTFPGEAAVAGVTVSVDISHTYKGDLTLTLISPSGTPLILHNRGGGSADDIVETFGDAGVAPFDPVVRLRGEPSLGIWTLRVNDGAVANQGTVNAWSLEICGRPFEAAPPEMRLHQVTLDGPAVRLRWWPYPGILSYRVYRSTDPSSAPSAFTDVTSEDTDPTDTLFLDTSSQPLTYWLVTALGPQGEGP